MVMLGLYNLIENDTIVKLDAKRMDSIRPILPVQKQAIRVSTFQRSMIPKNINVSKTDWESIPLML